MAQDISKKSYNVKNVTKVKSLRIALTNAYAASSSRTWSSNFGLCGFRADGKIAIVTPILFFPSENSIRIRPKNWVFLLKGPEIGPNSR